MRFHQLLMDEFYWRSKLEIAGGNCKKANLGRSQRKKSRKRAQEILEFWHLIEGRNHFFRFSFFVLGLKTQEAF